MISGVVSCWPGRPAECVPRLGASKKGSITLSLVFGIGASFLNRFLHAYFHPQLIDYPQLASGLVFERLGVLLHVPVGDKP